VLFDLVFLQCDLQPTASVSYNSSCTILLDTRWFMRLAINGINHDYNTTDTCGYVYLQI
jgi:hypothetical protein